MESSGMDLDKCFQKIKFQKNYYITRQHLIEENLWVLMSSDLHSKFLKYAKRVPDGPDRITRSQVAGMHVIHDNVKDVYVIPRIPLSTEAIEEAYRATDPMGVLGKYENQFLECI